MPPDPFAQPALPRRLAFLSLCLLIAGGLLALLCRVLAPGGWTFWEWLILVSYLGNVPWLAISLANALIGFGIQMGSPWPAAATVPQLRIPAPPMPHLRTALVLCVRQEKMGQVLPLMAPMLDGLAGLEDRFVFWVLSDTPSGPAAEAEATAIAAFAASRAGQGPAVHYRRRAENTGFKAGNIMDFLDHHAEGSDLYLPLDADSSMSAAAVLRLVGCMEADPKLAIVQHLTVGRPTAAPFPRLFQFGMRAGMRSWATGQGWWQLDEGPYWGHNAILRVAPFRDHARLPPLRDGSAILSHDQVEAVRLHGAGWKVRCLPDEDGSLEGNPPALPEYLARDRRWGAGNMQYWELLRLPGLTPMARWQFVQAIMLFFSAPLWLLMLLASVAMVATGGAEAISHTDLAAVMLGSGLAYYSPKLLGYLQVLLKPAMAARYGGAGLFARGVLAEMIFTVFFEPVALANKAIFLSLLPLGRRVGWGAQNRMSRRVGIADAARLLWPQTLLGIAAAMVLGASSGTALLWSLPFVGPLVLAIPFCLVTTSERFSAALVAHRLCALPEELAPGGAVGAERAVQPA